MTLSAAEIVDALFGSSNANADKLWDDLVYANSLANALNIRQAQDVYESVINTSTLEKVFADRLWALGGSPSKPNLAWACVYLREYVFLNFSISAAHFWRQLVEIVVNEPGYSSLPDQIKSILISTRGWISLKTSDKFLKAILSEQLTAMDSLDIDEIEAAHHQLVIGNVYRRLRKPVLAISHIKQAADLYTKHQKKFYIYQSNRSLADAFYYLNDFDKQYYDQALRLYEITFSMLPDNQPQAQCQHYYDIGWVYCETEFYDKALDAFYDGYNIANRNNLDIELAMQEWGLGRTYYMLRNFDEALRLLRSASFCFEYHHMKLMLAMCIQVEAACLQKMGLVDEALELAEKRGLPLQRQVDDPVQLHHMLRRVVYLRLKKRNWFRNSEIFLEYLRLRRQIKK
jgi:tetratricopeptide (TPR) repeat protein